ncbi:MAG TPA: FHA domain-containing protein [Deltaproteobacteria bacterium]|nr:FHA domain-containing protein [Deltaproteobacteria bacterium]HPP80617.1 FHA domain-containing protein [Deltaproteobacteria bacterium]
MKVRLVHIQGPLAGQIQEFTEPSISIGRHPSCQVTFPADLKTVSRTHALIVREGNRCKLIDKSTNGTFVNGRRVQGEVFLKDGDVIMFTDGGPKVSFLAELVDAAPPRPPTPPESTDAAFGRQEAAAQAQGTPARGAQAPAPRQGPPPSVPQAPAGEAPRVGKVQVPLIVQYGPSVRTFREVPVTIGSAPDADLVMAHAGMAPRHVMIFSSGGAYWVKDLTGRGMVTINGRPVVTEAQMNSMDLVSLGPGLPTFKYLGEGRLAEIEQEPAHKPETREAHTQPQDAPKPVKKPQKSIFDIFKR